MATAPQIDPVEQQLALPRAYEVEHNQWQRYPWMLRRYGQGADSVARGVPAYYSSEIAAHQAGKAWVQTGRRA